MPFSSDLKSDIDDLNENGDVQSLADTEGVEEPQPDVQPEGDKQAEESPESQVQVTPAEIQVTGLQNDAIYTKPKDGAPAQIFEIVLKGGVAKSTYKVWVSQEPSGGMINPVAMNVVTDENGRASVQVPLDLGSDTGEGLVDIWGGHENPGGQTATQTFTYTVVDAQEGQDQAVAEVQEQADTPPEDDQQQQFAS
jgi:hypothetical protein